VDASSHLGLILMSPSGISAYPRNLSKKIRRLHWDGPGWESQIL